MKYLAQVVLYISLIILVWKTIEVIDLGSNLTRAFASFEVLSNAMGK